MKLKETILRILKEEMELPIQLRRRVDFKNIQISFEEALDHSETRFLKFPHTWSNKDLDDFKFMVMSRMMENLYGSIYQYILSDGGDMFYRELWDYLEKHYSDRIENIYSKLKET